MRLIQYLDQLGAPRVATVAALGEPVRRIEGFASAYEMAQAAIARGTSLQQIAEASKQSAEAQSYAQLLADGRVLTPLMHPDPARCLVSGTGLTHLAAEVPRQFFDVGIAEEHAVLFAAGRSRRRSRRWASCGADRLFGVDGRCWSWSSTRRMRS